MAEFPSVNTNNQLQATIDQLKKDAVNKKNPKNNRPYFSRYYAVYYVGEGKRVTPAIGPLRGYNKRITVIPYIQTGIQYLRGAWVPSAGAGMQLSLKQYQNQEMNFRLLWEPYFFFNRDAANKLSTSRNDFITFKYNYRSGINFTTREIRFTQNFSAGYLVHRRGDWFESQTFKFSLPGLQTKNILLEPEAVFNKLFKHFSPSLKLTLYFE